MDAQHAAGSSGPELLGESPPEHGLPGRMLIVLLHVAGIAGFAGLVAADGLTMAERGARVPFALLVALLLGLLAEGLRRFDCSAWFFVMGTLGLTGVFMGLALFHAPLETIGAWGVFVLIAGWMHYLWSHRGPFWADPPTRASRSRPDRWVTPEWRAARLARIGDGSGGRSSAAHSRAETVRRNPA